MDVTEPERDYRDLLLLPDVIAARKQLGLAPVQDIEAGAPMTDAELAAVGAAVHQLKACVKVFEEATIQFTKALPAALEPLLAAMSATASALADVFARFSTGEDNRGAGPGRQ